MKTVAIIGGGASGIMAALTAAKDKDNRIILFERQQRIGRKLLATGNGRCNLTNVGAAIKNYHGEQPEFAENALGKFSPEDCLEFFHELGLLTVTEYGGRVYPLSNSANSVLDVLRLALEKAGVELRCSCPVRELMRSGKGYQLTTDDEKIYADYVIVACGGAAGEKLGGVSDGYELLKPLGHKRTKLYPCLVQLICHGDYPKALKGVRADGKVTLMSGDDIIAQGKGEIQFTETGISGPAAFDISRAASQTGEGATIYMDFLQDYSCASLEAMLLRRQEIHPQLEASELFTGMLHNRLGRMIVKYCGFSAVQPLKELSAEQLCKAARISKAFPLRLKGTEGFANAQVTAGGIKTTGFNPDTMESWFMPGLFVCGELLDVDGDCGGYNLQWAWASGNLAGRLGK
ncbi:MAG: NAD(P)/FAD-dependent oxidoreductase [Oscillospiraceae bacterium]|nr:NAD(P)/FAD-dependent oxidoreductase [Oscillospiraceae bacterium]